ncbi:MAG: hemin uptake protein HemP [Dongiaceae bacterium]
MPAAIAVTAITAWNAMDMRVARRISGFCVLRSLIRTIRIANANDLRYDAAAIWPGRSKGSVAGTAGLMTNEAPDRRVLPEALSGNAVPRVSSAELLCGKRELCIEHAGETYRLRITGKGKLILTK